MATYNGGQYIKEQLTSILGQLSQEDEVIISDDGSMDGTLDIIGSINDPRITVCQGSFHDIVLNFENALKRASGEVIFLSDQDDIWHPEKVSECLVHLERHSLVFSNLEVFTNSMADSKLFYNTAGPKTGLIRNIVKNHYIGATMAFRKEVLAKALPFPKGIYMHDIWLGMIAEITGSPFFIERPLIYYRRHEMNASETGSKSSNTIFKKISMRAVLIYHLIRRFL